ncbi:ABC transporter ATP-binding protein [Nocardia aurantia]|uniref:Vitamin B12 import ATP-binding protein BtuD n=1 Tax=Nocardia aurantia TaxID=2585199 RepID=A0A7K0DSK6_9NOCA|nr:ABC transporter ATP-binding protein [Nocardia aurantia]MQY28760.1 Vitamin B12 import ATP-binding protein BtuD [Nocardia aurantia]
MTRHDTVVEVDGLRMSYGSTTVLADVTFAIRRGEVLALLGPNGAGKTTTVEVLEGFRIRSGGRVSVLGSDPEHGDQRWRARLGVVLQSWRDHGNWRVRELQAQLGAYYAAYADETHPRPWDTDELIAAVGLTDRAGTRVDRLSGGQRRRLDVAVGLVGRPELLFLDEPTAGFDPRARREFHDLLLGPVRDTGITVLLTTHDLAEAEKLADRIVILGGGGIVAAGTASELARDIVGRDLVRWRLDGREFEQSTSAATEFVRELFARHSAGITDLEVRRGTLEDTYLTLVQRAEDTVAQETK